VVRVDDPDTASGWDGHLLLLHASEAERRSGVTEWVRRGLAQGEKVVYTEVAGEYPERSLLGVLRAAGLDPDGAVAAHRLAILPLGEFYPAVAYTGIVERALAEGHTGVRVSAEANAALTYLTRTEYADIEHAIGRLCRSHPVSALCQYEGAFTSGRWLRQAVTLHPGGIRERQFGTGDRAGGLAIEGAVDAHNDGLFATVLRGAAESASGVLNVDLGGVDHLGVGACRALVEATGEFRGRGGEVRLVAPRPGVTRVLRLLGVDGMMTVDPDGAIS
jgi:anti-sigma B factor antagonist